MRIRGSCSHHTRILSPRPIVANDLLWVRFCNFNFNLFLGLLQLIQVEAFLLSFTHHDFEEAAV